MRPTKLIRRHDGKLFLVYEAYCGEMSLEGGAIRDFLAVVKPEKAADVIDCIQHWNEPYSTDMPVGTRGAWFRSGGIAEVMEYDIGRMRGPGPTGEVLAEMPAD